MDTGRQARTRDTLLIKRRETTGRSKNTVVVAGGGGVKTTEKIHWPGPVAFYDRCGSPGSP
jgi:hypothetical protein